MTQRKLKNWSVDKRNFMIQLTKILFNYIMNEDSFINSFNFGGKVWQEVLRKMNS